MRTIVALGESLIDFVSSEPGTLLDAPSFVKAPGGAPANVAACIARLGGKSQFIGKRGDDAFGEFLAQTLQACGVDTSYYIPTNIAKTALAFVSLDSNGDRSFLFYRDPSADMLLEPAEIPAELFGNTDVLHIGSVSLAEEPSRSATLFAVKEAKRQGVLISYDPNWRPALWSSEKYGIESIALLYPDCDIIKINREELSLLCKTEDVQAGAEFLHQKGIRIVLITLDSEGCFYSYKNVEADRKDYGWVKGIPVTCVDTTGAGDAFIGAFLYQLSKSESPLNDISSIREWVEFAVYTSALVTLKRGAISSMPELKEVLQFREENHPVG